jgi:dipicolinate synthase subunit A
MLNTPLSNDFFTTHEIFAALSPGQIICAGKVDDATRELAGSMGLTVVDYLQREELAVSNAVAAAEGAIQLIMEETPITVCHARCLVIGLSAHREAPVSPPARTWRACHRERAQLFRSGVDTRLRL